VSLDTSRLHHLSELVVSGLLHNLEEQKKNTNATNSYKVSAPALLPVWQKQSHKWKKDKLTDAQILLKLEQDVKAGKLPASWVSTVNSKGPFELWHLGFSSEGTCPQCGTVAPCSHAIMACARNDV
jgi:hypothetical protein